MMRAKRIVSKFGSLVIPSPKFGAPQVAAGGISEGVLRQKLDLERQVESSKQKQFDLEKQLATAQSNRGNRFSDSAQAKAARELSSLRRN